MKVQTIVIANEFLTSTVVLQVYKCDTKKVTREGTFDSRFEFRKVVEVSRTIRPKIRPTEEFGFARYRHQETGEG